MSTWDELDAKYAQGQQQQPQSDPWDDLDKKYMQPSAPVQAAPMQQEKPRQIPMVKQPPTAELSRTARVGQGIIDPINGLAQMLYNALPSGFVKTMDAANNYVADKTGLLARVPEGGMNQFVAEREKAYQDQRKAAGQEGLDAYRLLGNIAAPTNYVIPGSRLLQTASLPAKIGIGAATGAAIGSTNPVNNVQGDDYWNQKLQQSLFGAAFGGAVPAISAGAGRLISPKASQNEQVQTLLSEGVKPSIGQVLGGNLAKAEEKLQSVPILGDAIRNVRNQANQQFETAAYNRALGNIGESLPKGTTGREALNYAESAIANKYNQTLDKIGAIKPDAQFSANVTELADMVKAANLPAQEADKFNYILSRVTQGIDKNGVITSDRFKRIESELTKYMKDLGRSGNIYENQISPAVRQLREEVRGMLGRQAGGLADDLQSANSAYSAFKQLQRAAGSTAAENGNITPAMYNAAVKALDRSKDKAAYARGSALNQDLADAGRSILTGTVPNSGTADRAMLGLLTGGVGAAVTPTIPVGLLGGAGLYTQPAQSLLRNMILSRPQNAPAIANAVRNQAPSLLIPFSQTLANLGVNN